MNFEFMRDRKSRLKVTIVIVVAALAAGSTVLQSRKQPAQPISTRPTAGSLSELINEADGDARQGNLKEASNKYRQALTIDPKSPKLKNKLIATEKRLLDEAPEQPGAGDTTSTADITIRAPNAPAWRPADPNDPQATPASILPPVMPGYKITQNGWLKEPNVAGATYAPRSRSVAKQIDRVLLTVGKFENNGGAKQLLDREYEMFSVDQQDIRINGHPAKFGLYNEARPDIFPIIASLGWTRGKWFFSLQAAPLIDRQTGTEPSGQFKRGIILDVAKKLGY